MKTITYAGTAAVQLRKLPANIRERLIAKLHRYAKGQSADVTALKGRPGLRLRVGDYRIVLVETAETIAVQAAGHRRDVYK